MEQATRLERTERDARHLPGVPERKLPCLKPFPGVHHLGPGEEEGVVCRKVPVVRSVHLKPVEPKNRSKQAEGGERNEIDST